MLYVVTWSYYTFSPTEVVQGYFMLLNKLVDLVFGERIYGVIESEFVIFHEGRCGRAGRSGEAITFYTEADIPYLRNIANVMSASGCEVPSWAMALRKQKWKKHRPGRESISTQPKDEQESTNKKKKKDGQESTNKKKRRKMSKNRAIVGARELSLVDSSKT